MNPLYQALVAIAALLCAGGIMTHRMIRNRRKAKALSDFAGRHAQQIWQMNDVIAGLVVVIDQLGELLDHAGVCLEGGTCQQEAEDLKFIAKLLRRQGAQALGVDNDGQAALGRLGQQYGIAPDKGNRYSLRQAVRIAENALERALVLSGATTTTTTTSKTGASTENPELAPSPT